MVQQHRVVGTNPVEFLSGRMSTFGKFVVVVAGADNPHASGRLGRPAGDCVDNLFNRTSHGRLDRNLVQSGAIATHVVVGIVEARHHRSAVHVDGAGAGPGEGVAIPDTHDPVTKDRDTRRSGHRPVHGQHIRIVEYEIRLH